jgi:hypothetical protein
MSRYLDEFSGDRIYVEPNIFCSTLLQTRDLGIHRLSFSSVAAKGSSSYSPHH